ncbi:hypothetical protein BN1200_710105 [Klebsiella variicola]|nr:hypothetical protein BN1200_710105 [Klebsiella variicola]
MTITCNLYIDGQWHDAEGRRTFTRRHPAHDDVASVAAAASLADGKRCVEAAAKAFPLWRDTSPAERRRLLLDAAEHMLLREAKFIAAMAAETGATAHWAGFNVHLAADILREAAALTTQIEGQIIPSNVPGNLAMGVRQGRGGTGHGAVERTADSGYPGAGNAAGLRQRSDPQGRGAVAGHSGTDYRRP